MFIAALFTIGMTWKQPKSPSADEWIKKIGYIYTMEYYSTTKKKNWIICKDVDGPKECYTEWSKSEREKQISYINAYTWNLEKWYVCSVMSDSATSWTITHQAPLSMEFSRQEYWSGLPFLTPRDLPNPGIEPWSPALAQILYPLSHWYRWSYLQSKNIDTDIENKCMDTKAGSGGWWWEKLGD